MLFLENIKMAIDSIFSNVLRSILTMLGIIIGVAAVITILAVGNGATEEITDTFADVGATTVTLSASDSEDEISGDAITLDDLDVLRESIDEIDYISPLVRTNGQVNIEDGPDKTVMMEAGNLDTQQTSQTMSSQIIAGRYYNEQELENAAEVVVIDADLAQAVFNRTDVVGENLRIVTDSTPLDLLIIGVTEGMYEDLQGEFDTAELPSFVSIPYTTLDNLLPQQTGIEEVHILVNDTDEISSVSQQAVRLLELRHDAVDSNIYNAQNFLNALDQVNGVLDLFIQFIAAVAGIALLVGGIGVMNIMLVSVTERTREIGTRKALGATTNMILVQFLIEAVLLSVIGGLIGLLIGAGLSSILGSALNIVPQITFGNVSAVLIFSIAIGVFFGIYPAKRAADLNPIDALRYE
jgi:putative ABC transport system permease protein